VRLFRRSAESEAATDAALERTRRSWAGRIGNLLRGSEINPELWDSLEEVLIGADAGVETTFNVLERVRAKSPRQITEVRAGLRQELIAILEAPVGSGRLWGPEADGLKQRPAVVLVVGVNGTGKTTVVARLAFAYREDGLRVMAAAGDTFRAAAVEQLRNWGERLEFDVIAHQQGSDPAAVAFDALEAAQARGHDLVLVDTAGRLHNKQNLMDELSKIRRVIERQLGHAPDEVALILDATTGQNGLAQARAFTDAVGVTSVVLTKLDGSARGGIVFAVAAELGLPVRFIGTGDGPGDLAPFDAESFVDALLGVRQVAEA
jgi:fused signal recognition particle receptor